VVERLTQFYNYTNTVTTYVNFLGEFITNVVLILVFLYGVNGATLQTTLSHCCQSEDLNTFSPFSFGSKGRGAANSSEKSAKNTSKRLEKQKIG